MSKFRRQSLKDNNLFISEAKTVSARENLLILMKSEIHFLCWRTLRFPYIVGGRSLISAENKTQANIWTLKGTLCLQAFPSSPGLCSVELWCSHSKGSPVTIICHPTLPPQDPTFHPWAFLPQLLLGPFPNLAWYCFVPMFFYFTLALKIKKNWAMDSM